MVDAVFLPAGFVFLGAERFFFAEADGADASGGDSLIDQSFLHGLSAAGAEGDVVFLGAAVVAMAFDQDLDGGMLREEGLIVLDGGDIVGADVEFVVVEENIFDVAREEFFVGERRCVVGDRGGYGDASRGVGGTSGTFGEEGVGDGFSGGDGAGAGG